MADGTMTDGQGMGFFEADGEFREGDRFTAAIARVGSTSVEPEPGKPGDWPD
jgi:hypothetical protein